jgi:hypothetical protein
MQEAASVGISQRQCRCSKGHEWTEPCDSRGDVLFLKVLDEQGGGHTLCLRCIRDFFLQHIGQVTTESV